MTETKTYIAVAEDAVGVTIGDTTAPSDAAPAAATLHPVRAAAGTFRIRLR